MRESAGSSKIDRMPRRTFRHSGTNRNATIGMDTTYVHAGKARASRPARSSRFQLPPILQNEGNFHSYLICGNPIALYLYFLLFDPGAPDVSQGSRGTLNSLLHGILEALGGRGANFCDTGDRHTTKGSMSARNVSLGCSAMHREPRSVHL
jgi:hypothetical protein